MLIEYVLSVAPDAVCYLNVKLLPRLKEKMWKHRNEIQVGWTNNSESMNHAIKAFVDWKQKNVFFCAEMKGSRKQESQARSLRACTHPNTHTHTHTHQQAHDNMH